MQVYVVGDDYGTEKMFETEGWEIVPLIEEAQLIQFVGGSDVSPSFYGSLPHPRTSSYLVRDVKEKELFDMWWGKKPMAGICRGGQFLHVMNGGSMYQDVDKHGIQGTHPCIVKGRVWDVTSTHHQMMKYEGKGELVGFTLLSTRKDEVDKEGNIITTNEDLDAEIIFYKNTQCLCFQPHPEYGVKECKVLYFKLLKEYLGV